MHDTSPKPREMCGDCIPELPGDIVITPQLVRELGTCGVKCSGPKAGVCGLVFELPVTLGRVPDKVKSFEAGLEIAERILRGEERITDYLPQTAIPRRSII